MYFDESECGVVRTKTVKRRHREFINLQSRLEDNKLYSKILKGITSYTCTYVLLTFCLDNCGRVLMLTGKAS